ncbi:hypothetical protein [Rhizobium sp. Rhizsp42]|uniref:hypothetical protein n=1 Tax=Rhizobium sp. Rhizsp42 TaxID=3243034 RepID=UPI0039B010E4
MQPAIERVSTPDRSSKAFQGKQGRTTAEKPHRPYEDTPRSGFLAAFRTHHVELDNDDLEHIANSPRTMDRTRTFQTRCGGSVNATSWPSILTNSDDDLIAPTVERIGAPFDHVITAQQAQAYKPSRKFLEHAYRAIGVTADETVHVAMGMYWDMKARHALGFRGIWVNRPNEKGNPD